MFGLEPELVPVLVRVQEQAQVEQVELLGGRCILFELVVVDTLV